MRFLRFGLKDQPGGTAGFGLGEGGAVARLVAQPPGIFRPKGTAGEGNLAPPRDGGSA